ncbi:MAG: histidine kinase [Pseudomonadota bacterium]
MPNRLPWAMFFAAQLVIWLLYGGLLISQTIEFRIDNGLPLELTTIANKALAPVVLGFVLTTIFHIIVLTQSRSSVRRIFVLSLIFTIIAACVMAFLQYVAKWQLGYIADWQTTISRWPAYVPSRVVVLGLWISAYLSIMFARDSFYHRKQSLALQAAADEARAEMLRYQLNPHLLFNALNTVSSHILDRDFERADFAIQKLSDLMRLSLENNEARSVTLGQEIDRLEVYLDLERIRFGDSLEIRIDMDDSLETVQVPPMLMQPLIENAMKHGISRSSNGGEIAIQAKKQGDRVVIVVTNINNGYVAYQDERASGPSFGVGLRNVEQRLAMAYGPEARLVTDASGHPASYSAAIYLPAEEHNGG